MSECSTSELRPAPETFTSQNLKYSVIFYPKITGYWRLHEPLLIFMATKICRNIIVAVTAPVLMSGIVVAGVV